ncbi:MAG: Gfo/Idh/MocA family oxidoreductase [Acidobacteriota bacterium]
MARIGIIGTGWGARVQVPAFREAGLEVVGLAGRDGNKTAAAAKELGVEAFAEWRSLASSANVDLVSIVTPPAHHLEMATFALEAGKHVLCEKPTAMNAGEAGQLVAIAANHPDAITLIDHELRFLPSFLAARQHLYDLGAIWYAEVRYASPGRGDVSRPWTRWSDATQGGGVWGAVGSHFVDALRYLIGEVDSVQAELRTIIRERPFEGKPRVVTSDDFAAVHARLEKGVVAAMTFSAVAGGPDEPATLTIHGEKGAMRLSQEELLHAKRGALFTRTAGHDLEHRPGNSPGGAFGSGTVHLGRALRAALDDGRREALASAATFVDGLAQQRVLDAARKSSEHDGIWEKVKCEE